MEDTHIKHKMLMDSTIALAIIHAVLSGIIGFLVKIESPLLKKIFFGISVVINIIILILAYVCRNLDM